MTSLDLQGRLRMGLNPKGRKKDPGPPPFSPAAIGDLAFWYDAEQSQQTAPGGAVKRWGDLSGNNNDAEQEDAAARPLPVSDESGRSALRFDGVDDVLQVATPPDLAAGATVFVVFRMRQRVDFAGIFSAGAAAGVDHEQYFTLQNAAAASEKFQLFGHSLEADQLIIESIDSGEVQYAVFTMDAAGGSLRDASGTTADISSATAFGTPYAIVLGARLDDGLPFAFGAIDLYEVGLYGRVLVPAELDQLESYLRAKRGLFWSPRFLGADLAWLHDVEQSPLLVSGGAVDRWDDLSGSGRHLVQNAAARPVRTTDANGRHVVRFDGVDDLMAMTGPLPALDPFSAGVIFTVRSRDDFAGILSAAPASGPDVTDFWSLRLTTAEGGEVQLAGQQNEIDPIELERPEVGAAQIAIWTVESGSASLRDGAGQLSDTFDGGFGAPAEIVLGGRFDGAPFGNAAIDVFATLGVGRVLSADEQTKLIDWAQRRWGL